MLISLSRLRLFGDKIGLVYVYPLSELHAGTQVNLLMRLTRTELSESMTINFTECINRMEQCIGIIAYPVIDLVICYY